MTTTASDAAALLGERTSDDLARVRPVLLVPLGAIEQHGPHLPLDTDTRIADAVARAAVAGLRAAGREALAAPALAYGASGEHEGFPGTVSLGSDALARLLVEYGRSASGWAGRMVFVNGHGGNVEAVRLAVSTLAREGRDAVWAPCAPAAAERGLPVPDAHAGRTETSLLLHLAPESVRLDRAEPGETAPLRDLLPRLRAEGVRGVSSNGVLGDPSGASAAEGRALFDAIVRRVVADAGLDDAPGPRSGASIRRPPGEEGRMLAPEQGERRPDATEEGERRPGAARKEGTA